MDIKHIVGNSVKEHREALSLTQEEFCYEIGLSTSHLRDIERARANPTITTLSRIASGLHIDVLSMVTAPMSAPYHMDQIMQFLCENFPRIEQFSPTKKMTVCNLFFELTQLLEEGKKLTSSQEELQKYIL